MLSSCDTDIGSRSLTSTDSSSALTLSTPTILTQTRAIDQARLVLSVVINGMEVNMQRQGDEWTGAINVPAGEVASLELTWLEFFTDGTEPLRLASYSDTFGPIATAVNLPLFEGDYVSTGIDDDQDGISNLAERRAGSNPRDASDPAPSADGIADGAVDNSVIDVIIAKIAPSQAPPVIDGHYDDVWNTSTFIDVNGAELSIDNLILGNPVTRSDGNTEFQWSALHDGTYLYVSVLGEYALGATLFADSRAAWKDDSVELYVDGDNSKLRSYDQVNDYSFVVPQLKFLDTLQANNSIDINGRVMRGFQSLPLPEDFEFASCLCTTRRTLWEFRVSLAQVGIQANRPFGIEVQLNDDQNGGDRDVKWAWIHPSRNVPGAVSDATWRNPSLMGTALLQ